MQWIKSLPTRRLLIIGAITVILVVTLFVLLFRQSESMDEKQFVFPTDSAWLYTNGKWIKTDEPDWGEVMKGMQTGTRAHIETNSSFAILKKRGNGDEITVFVDGETAVTYDVPRDGKVHEIPIYSENKGWHRIEVAFASANNEIDGLYISKRAKVRTPEDQRKRLVVIGHSYAEGCCITNKGVLSFASLVGDILGVESINTGIGRTDINVGGDLSGLSRVQSDVIQLKPDYVLSVYGFNVRSLINTGKMSHERYQKDYTEFIKTITDALPETHVFASGIISLKGISDEKMEPFNQDIKNACSSVKNCTYIDLTGKWNDDNYAKYVSDGIHPSEEGHQFLAEEYAKVISTVMNK